MPFDVRYPYQDITLADAERVEDLLGRLSLREKVGQLNQRMLGWHAYRRTGSTYELTDELHAEIERWGGLGSIYSLHRADAWSGMDWETGILPEDGAEVAALFQQAVIDGGRWGIPALTAEDAAHGHLALGSIMLPSPIGLANGWDPEWIREESARVARELRARGSMIALTAGVDILRDPRWGRAEETYGSDPLLASRLIAAAVEGLQGSSDPGARIDGSHVGAVVKHFAGQGSGAGGRNASGASLGQRELHAIHLPPMYAAARAGAVGVIAAYNDIDGVPCTANRELLTGLLREKWGFGGFVMADLYAVDQLDHFGDPARGGALALRAGLDMSMGDTGFTMLEEALERGLVSAEQLDTAVRRVLAAKFRLGLLDGSPVERRREVIRPAAPDPARLPRGMTLLTNDGALPFGAGQRRIAVIGPNGDDVYAMLGDYIPPQAPGTGVTIAAGLREKGLTVDVVTGSLLLDPLPGGLEQARLAAACADAVVLALGGSSRRLYGGQFTEQGAAIVDGRYRGQTCGEGVDLAEVRLDPHQLELARAVSEVARQRGVPVVAVVVAGRPHGLAELVELCNAVLYAWYPGADGGRPVADVLLGRCEPQGRLPVDLPRSSAVLPVSHLLRRENAPTYVDSSRVPVFRFGHGLGYTDWELAGVEVSGDTLRPGERIDVDATVRNVGGRAGRQVVQLYGRFLTDGIVPWDRQLVDFGAVTLGPGESAVVRLTLDRAALPLGLTDPAAPVPAGRFLLAAGFSSDVDLAAPHATIAVPGTS